MCIRDRIFDEVRTGARVGLRKTLFGSDFIIGGVSYTLENVGIIDVAESASQVFKDEEGRRLVSKVGTTISYDTRAGGLLPNGGQLTRLTSEVAGGPVGADTDFYKVELGTKYYFEGFDEDHIFELQGQVGVVEEYGDTTRVPLFDREFLGGLYSLRGCRFRDIGPKDLTGEPIGGRTSWLAAAEYSDPIIERFRFALFYYVGMVYQQAFSFSTDYSYTDSRGNLIRGNTGTYNDTVSYTHLTLPTLYSV